MELFKFYQMQIKEDESKAKLISFVSGHFGPMRGLSFIIEGDEATEVKDYVDNQPESTISKIWENTLIASRAMEFPLRFAVELETPPITVNTFEQGEKEILKRVEEGNNTGDPFFFRSFVL